MKSQYQLVKIASIEEFKSLENDWNALYDKSDKCTIFSSWDWMFTWWEVFHDELSRKLFILCLYDGDALIGIAPFHTYTHYPKSIIQGRTLQFIASGNKKEENVTSEFLDLIVQSGKEDALVGAVSDYLLAHKRHWDFADFEYLLEDALVFQCFKSTKKVATKTMQDGVRFFISPKENFDSYKAQMGNRWRKMYDRKTRVLERDGAVKVISTKPEESPEKALSQLADMHCERIRDKIGYCAFDSEKFSLFHHEILKRLHPKNKALIKTLYLDDKELATYYVFTDKDQWHYYQSGFHSAYANRYSPLFLLICNEIGEVVTQKMRFDFMYEPSTSSYKKEQYAAEHERMYRLYWSPAPIRFYIFNTAKFVQERSLSIKDRLFSKLKSREKS
jgi:CelD/BcsL family acetyltransferase involved in cellulose biosynthesis